MPYKAKDKYQIRSHCRHWQRKDSMLSTLTKSWVTLTYSFLISYIPYDMYYTACDIYCGYWGCWDMLFSYLHYEKIFSKWNMETWDWKTINFPCHSTLKLPWNRDLIQLCSLIFLFFFHLGMEFLKAIVEHVAPEILMLLVWMHSLRNASSIYPHSLFQSINLKCRAAVHYILNKHYTLNKQLIVNFMFMLSQKKIPVL